MVPKTPSCPMQNASLYTFVRSSLSSVAESAAYAARSDASCAACSADLSRCALCTRQNLPLCSAIARICIGTHLLGLFLFQCLLFQL